MSLCMGGLYGLILFILCFCNFFDDSSILICKSSRDPSSVGLAVLGEEVVTLTSIRLVSAIFSWLVFSECHQLLGTQNLAVDFLYTPPIVSQYSLGDC